MHQQVSGKLLARIGTTVQQKYRIQRLVGVGGMAVVYAAAHRNGHRVAIKFLLEHGSSDPDIRHLFSREAYVANQVGHPGVVPVLDDDVDDEGCPFLIMPLLEGETLRARWERANRRLPLAEVSMLMSDVLEVLASAHEKGIVHRDIKPENLFVTIRGEVQVLDFGIARRTQADGNATITGRMFGTPAFMPPEQAIGDRNAIGPHSDCWAVGATIFNLLSGEYVHHGDSAGALLVAAATKPARSLSQAAPLLPMSIVHFVDKALALEPSSRWQSATEMRDALLMVFEGAIGKPFSTAAARIREEIVQELSPKENGTRAETLDPTEALRDVTDVAQRAREPSGGAVRPSHDHLARLSRSDGPTVLEAGLQPAAKRNHRRAWFLLLGCAGIIAVGSTLAAITGNRLTTTAPRTEQLLDSGLLGAVTQPASSNSGALVHFESGIQSWRDASESAAEQSFARALELDPGLAAAHLYSAMLKDWTDDVARAHHHEASRQRRQLAPRDQALLEAFAPAMATPPDLGASAARLASAREKYPSDWLVNYELAYTLLKLGKVPDAIEILNEILRRDPTVAIAWSEKALSFGFMDDKANTRDAVNECLRVSPYGTACLVLRVHLESNEGQCADAERFARKLMAIPSPKDSSAIRLAEAIHGRGAPLEGVHDVLDQAWQLAPQPRQAIVHAENDALFNVLVGSFSAVQRDITAWSAAIANVRYEDDHARLGKIQLYTAMELGDHQQASRLATEYIAKREALQVSTYFDSEILPLRIKYLTGTLSHQEFDKRRQSWLQRTTAVSNFVDSTNYRWMHAYALAVATASDAEEAVRVLPQYLPIVDSLSRDVDVDDAIGYMYLQAGDVQKALPYLQRGAHSCKATSYPFEQTWANLHLGMALEQMGDLTGACAAYNVVLTRWGNEPRSVSAQSARARLAALRCKGGPPPPSVRP